MQHIIKHRLSLLALVRILILLMTLSACTSVPNAPTPTTIIEALLTPSLTPSATASATATLAAQLQPPTETPTPPPPTDTLTPSPTPGPLEYTIQQGDTLLFIIQQPPFNYRDSSVIAEILRLNPTIPNADRLPAPGTVILIPLPTPTPTPIAEAETATAQAGIPVVDLPISTTILQHSVREGETILGIAEQYRVTLRILSDLNPDIRFINCDFANPSGGPDCAVFIEVGQAINVPAPTPTPTLSPTPSGSETPTPTPTFAAPFVSFPPRDAVINSAVSFTLQWVSTGVLSSGQIYLIQIEDMTAATSYNDITLANSYRIPASLVPTSGQPHQFRWRVSVAQQNVEGLYAVVGGEGEWRMFTWTTGS